MPALEQAPALPTGCVDFNKLHEVCLKGSPDPLKHAVIVTGLRSPRARLPDRFPRPKLTRRIVMALRSDSRRLRLRCSPPRLMGEPQLVDRSFSLLEVKPNFESIPPRTRNIWARSIAPVTSCWVRRFPSRSPFRSVLRAARRRRQVPSNSVASCVLRTSPRPSCRAPSRLHPRLCLRRQPDPSPLCWRRCKRRSVSRSAVLISDNGASYPRQLAAIRAYTAAKVATLAETSGIYARCELPDPEADRVFEWRGR